MKLSFTPAWRHVLAAVLLAAPLLASAQADPPQRVAYLSALDGSAQVTGNGLPDWSPAAINWPLTSGSQLALEAGARAELQGGTVVARAAGPAALSVTALDGDTTQLAVTQGTLAVHVRSLRAGERVEIDTPQLAVVATQPGDYRVDVDPGADTTRVTVRAGAATLYGEAAQAMSATGGEQLLVAGRQLRVLRAAATGGRDGFDQWVAARIAEEDRSPSARYLPRDVPGYAQLDAWGQWAEDPGYGPVWYPQVTVADWAPYRYGRWAWVEPWGWTWVDDAPWGFAPSHYGRWAQIGPRWAWVPGRFGPRPVYAPALVAFVGAGNGSAGWSLGLSGGRPGAAWFPLAPGEYWTPGYHASDRYRQNLNWGEGRWRPRPPEAGGYLFQHRPGAISAGPMGPDGPSGGPGRPPRFIDGSRLPAGALSGARVVPPPPRGHWEGSAAWPGAARAPAGGMGGQWPRPGMQQAPAPQRPPNSGLPGAHLPSGPGPQSPPQRGPGNPQHQPDARPGFDQPASGKPLAPTGLDALPQRPPRTALPAGRTGTPPDANQRPWSGPQMRPMEANPSGDVQRPAQRPWPMPAGQPERHRQPPPAQAGMPTMQRPPHAPEGRGADGGWPAREAMRPQRQEMARPEAPVRALPAERPQRGRPDHMERGGAEPRPQPPRGAREHEQRDQP